MGSNELAAGLYVLVECCFAHIEYANSHSCLPKLARFISATLASPFGAKHSEGFTMFILLVLPHYTLAQSQ